MTWTCLKENQKATIRVKELEYLLLSPHSDPLTSQGSEMCRPDRSSPFWRGGPGIRFSFSLPLRQFSLGSELRVRGSENGARSISSLNHSEACSLPSGRNPNIFACPLLSHEVRGFGGGNIKCFPVPKARRGFSCHCPSHQDLPSSPFPALRGPLGFPPVSLLSTLGTRPESRMHKTMTPVSGIAPAPSYTCQKSCHDSHRAASAPLCSQRATVRMFDSLLGVSISPTPASFPVPTP